MLLVTGGTGFLGQAVVEELLRRSPGAAPALRLLSRRALPPAWVGRIQHAPGDLTDPGAVDRAVAGCDRVLHLAAVTHAASAARYDAVNREGTRLLVEAARRHGTGRFVFVSTRAVHPDGGAYARSKRAAEDLVASALPDFVIVRLAEVYGKEGGRGIVDVIGWARRRRWVPVIGSGRHTLAPLHRDDAAAALVQALVVGERGQTYTVTGPETLTYLELVERIGEALGRRPRRLHVPVWLARRLVAVAARQGWGPFAIDQVDRLVCPKPGMDPETPRRLGLAFRRFSDELPRLVAAVGGGVTGSRPAGPG